jgi:hypothetical protein
MESAGQSVVALGRELGALEKYLIGAVGDRLRAISRMLGVTRDGGSLI